MNESTHFEQNELVFSRDDDGNIMSGGYKLDTSYTDKQVGGGLSSLAIPAGLLLLQQNYESISSKINKSSGDVIPDSLYDKLLQLKSVSKPKPKSKKKSNTLRNKTHKKR